MMVVYSSCHVLLLCCPGSSHPKTSSFMPYRWCVAWGMLVLFSSFLGLSSAVTVPAAQAAALTLPCESCSAPWSNRYNRVA